MIRKLLRKPWRLAKRIYSLPSNLYKALKYYCSSDLSYQSGKTKSLFATCLEQIAWTVKWGEANTYYYVYGFDKLGKKDLSDYIGYNHFKRIRNERNGLYMDGRYSCDYRCLLKDKFIFGQILKSLGFQAPKTIGLMINGKILPADNTDGKRYTSVKDIVESGCSDFWIKGLLGEQADSVFHLQVTNGTATINGKSSDLSFESKAGTYLLQEGVVQHEKMAKLYPLSVNTIRLVTIYKKGKASPFSSALRIGAKGNHSDNQAIGGLVGKINLENGTTEGAFYFKPGYGTMTGSHPDTGHPLANFTIPFFREALKQALALHEYFYGIASIAWDIAITENGPVFIEGNDNWGINMHQVCEGPLKSRFLSAMS